MTRALLAAAATLALTVPVGVAIAQDAVVATDAAGNTYVLTAEQQVMYDAWPADRRTMYDGWPNTYRVYYWTLTPDQQRGWWALTDEQRGQVYAMTPEQRTAAWASIATQMSAAATPAGTASTTTTTSTTTNATTGVTTTTTADTVTTADGQTTTTAAATTAMPEPMASGAMQFVRKETVQPVAASADASADAAALASGDLPVCKEGQQDGCINSWEKNKTGTRPLNYWPGKPASEIPGSKPADPQ
jgi:hypothetical protein